MSKDSETDQDVVAALLQELQAVIEDAPLHEILALFEVESSAAASSTNEPELQTTGIQGNFAHVCKDLESLAERASLADRVAIGQLVSLGEFIARTLQELGEAPPKSATHRRPAPEGSEKTGSWSVKVATALRSLSEASNTAITEASSELMSNLPDAEFILPHGFLETNERSSASAVLLAELCERLIQRR